MKTTDQDIQQLADLLRGTGPDAAASLRRILDDLEDLREREEGPACASFGEVVSEVLAEVPLIIDDSEFSVLERAGQLKHILGAGLAERLRDFFDRKEGRRQAD